jgi:hypothetical protein
VDDLEVIPTWDDGTTSSAVDSYCLFYKCGIIKDNEEPFLRVPVDLKLLIRLGNGCGRLYHQEKNREEIFHVAIRLRLDKWAWHVGA